MRRPVTGNRQHTRKMLLSDKAVRTADSAITLSRRELTWIESYDWNELTKQKEARMSPGLLGVIPLGWCNSQAQK